MRSVVGMKSAGDVLRDEVKMSFATYVSSTRKDVVLEWKRGLSGWMTRCRDLASDALLIEIFFTFL